MSDARMQKQSAGNGEASENTDCVRQRIKLAPSCYLCVGLIEVRWDLCSVVNVCVCVCARVHVCVSV